MRHLWPDLWPALNLERHKTSGSQFLVHVPETFKCLRFSMPSKNTLERLLLTFIGWRHTLTFDTFSQKNILIQICVLFLHNEILKWSGRRSGKNLRHKNGSWNFVWVYTSFLFQSGHGTRTEPLLKIYKWIKNKKTWIYIMV